MFLNYECYVSDTRRPTALALIEKPTMSYSLVCSCGLCEYRYVLGAIISLVTENLTIVAFQLLFTFSSCVNTIL